MKTKKTATLASLVALGLGLGLGACTPKKDTAKPDGDGAACTEEAKVCPDGTSVSREGPDCEFAACPGEADDALDDALDEEPADADEEPADEADADEAEEADEAEAE